MPPRASFASILEEHLGPAVAAAQAGPTYQPAFATQPYVFVQFETRSSGLNARPTKTRPYQGARPITKARTLTASQQHALASLAALGANLGPDFTATELRRAFRSLARQYHPDRHPNTSRTELDQLGRIFAEIADYHRSLAQVGDGAGTGSAL